MLSSKKCFSIFFGYLFAVLSGIFPDSGWASWLAGLGELDVKYFSWSTVQGAGNVPEFLAGGVNLVFLIPALIYFVHVYLLKPKP